MPDREINAVIEQAARDSYGRLLAFLAARSRDVAAAEDALAGAFVAALETWPKTGVPDKPEAWLLVSARRKLTDEARHRKVHAEATPVIAAATEQAQQAAAAEARFPDERLKMLFLCAHPAIDPLVRTPLMLQVVLGLDAARIASAFLVSPAAMGQRLSRAKAKIRDARVRFEMPDAKELPERLEGVLEAIYAAYASGWDDVAGADARRRGLAEEAMFLGRMLVEALPDEPEAAGLLSLMLHCEARREARRSPEGSYVPLSDQDVSRWSREAIGEADRWLHSASRAGRAGRFQLEAAIQSLHASRAWTGRTDWEGVALLYEGLARLAPTAGVLVARAAAMGEARGPEAAWQLLRSIPENSMGSYQPYWAVAGRVLRRMGRRTEAAAAYARAIGLCEDAATREFLLRESGGG